MGLSRSISKSTVILWSLEMSKIQGKQALWFYHYIDATNPDTFLHATNAARAAGYQCKNERSFSSIGHENLKKLEVHIVQWLDEAGLSEVALKTKLLKLLEARETKFFAYQGAVVTEKAVECLDIQIKALDMAFKARGMYAPEKKELSGPGGGPIETKLVDVPPEPKSLAEWESWVKESKAKQAQAKTESIEPGL